MEPPSSGDTYVPMQQYSSNKILDKSLKVNGVEKTFTVQGDTNLVSHEGFTGQSFIGHQSSPISC